MTIAFVAMGEPMLEYNQQPIGPDGRRLYLEGFGGDTSNAAIAAARQGVPTAYLTAVGEDAPGDAFVALWEREGIDISGVVRSPTHPTAVYFVTHGPDGHTFAYYRRNSAASRHRPVDVPQAMIAEARILYASGISTAISDSAADAVFRAIDIARRNQTQVAFDTNYRPRLWPAARASAIIHAAVAQSDIALPGLEDAAQLTGLTDPDAVADFYLRLGPAVVALKMGAAGVLLATADQRIRIPPHPTDFVDGTGAGDTFCGSFCARIILNDTPEQAARYASVAAALKCRGYGAVGPIPQSADVLAELAKAG